MSLKTNQNSKFYGDSWIDISMLFICPRPMNRMCLVLKSVNKSLAAIFIFIGKSR